jgi:hypothetical protein
MSFSSRRSDLTQRASTSSSSKAGDTQSSVCRKVPISARQWLQKAERERQCSPGNAARSHTLRKSLVFEIGTTRARLAGTNGSLGLLGGHCDTGSSSGTMNRCPGTSFARNCDIHFSVFSKWYRSISGANEAWAARFWNGLKRRILWRPVALTTSVENADAERGSVSSSFLAS